MSLTAKADALDKLWALGFDEKAAISAVGLDMIEWIGKPEPPPPPPVPEQMQPDQVPPPNVPQTPPTKAVKAARRREEVIGNELPGFNDTMRQFLDDQAARIAADIARTLDQLTKAERKAAPDIWWNQEREDGLLREALRGLYVRLARTALGTVADTVDKIVYPRQVKAIVERMLTEAAFRITGINETTRDAVAQHLAVGAARGYSISQIANGFTSADQTETFPGLRTLPAFDDARAELVARTETMLGYNKSALLGYQEFDVTSVEAIDGDFDEVCQERNGQIVHPRGGPCRRGPPQRDARLDPAVGQVVPRRSARCSRRWLPSRPSRSVPPRPITSTSTRASVTVTPTEPAMVNVTVPPPSVTVNESAPADGARHRPEAGRARGQRRGPDGRHGPPDAGHHQGRHARRQRDGVARAPDHRDA